MFTDQLDISKKGEKCRNWHSEILYQCSVLVRLKKARLSTAVKENAAVNQEQTDTAVEI